MIRTSIQISNRRLRIYNPHVTIFTQMEYDCVEDKIRNRETVEAKIVPKAYGIVAATDCEMWKCGFRSTLGRGENLIEN